MIYCYYIANKLASLHKIHTNGDDCEDRPVKIGRYETDKQAREACLKHYEKACNIARAAGRSEPQIMWM